MGIGGGGWSVLVFSRLVCRVHPPWERPLSQIEAAAVLFALSNEHRNLEFHINQTRNVVSFRPVDCEVLCGGNPEIEWAIYGAD